MASGTITLLTSNTDLKGRVTWSSTQNTSGNYSTVTATVQMARADSYSTWGVWTGFVWASSTGSGNPIADLFPLTDFSKQATVSSDWVTVKSFTFTVPHNSNGYGECWIMACVDAPNGTSLEGDGVVSQYKYGDKLNLGTIARYAYVTSAPNFNDEENPTIQYRNPAGNNATTLQACISLDGSAADIAYRDISKTGTSYTFNLTDAERKVLRQATTGSNSRSVKFFIKTVLNGQTYYSPLAKTFTVINATPIFSTAFEDVDATTLALTGNKEVFIKGYSDAKYTGTVTLKKEATLASFTVTHGDETKSGLTGTFTNINSSQFTIRAVDSRGNSNEFTTTRGMVNYIPVTCSQEVEIALTDDTAATVTLTIKGQYFNGSFGAQANALTLQVRHTQNDGSMGGWVTLTNGLIPTFSGNTYTLKTTITGLQYDRAYTFQCKAIDKLSNATTGQYTAKLVPVFDWGKDDFKFNVPVSINGANVDAIVEQGTSGGWTYRKWASGIAECWAAVDGTGSLTNQLNGFYYTSSISANFPFTFAEKPVVMVDGGVTSNMAFAREFASAVDYARFMIVGVAQITNFNYTVKIHAIGKWK